MHEIYHITKDMNAFEEGVLENIMHDLVGELGDSNSTKVKGVQGMKRTVLLGLFAECESRMNTLSEFEKEYPDSHIGKDAHRLMEELEVAKFRISGHIHMNINGICKIDPDIFEMTKILDTKWQTFTRCILEMDQAVVSYGNTTIIKDNSINKGGM